MLGIVFCTDGIFPYQIGGMQRHSRKLIESLAKNEIQIVVVHPHNESIFNDFDNIVEYHVKGIDISKKYLIESYYYSKRVFDC